MNRTKVTFNEGELLKIVAMLLLPAVHIMEYSLAWIRADVTKLADSIIGLCAIGPVIFVLCIGYKLGMRRNYKSLIRDGVQFLLFGVILNILRWIIPYIVRGIFLEFDIERIIISCLKSDIYYFVGLYFITFGLLKKLNVKKFGIIIIALLMFFINTFISLYIEIDNSIISAIIGNFIYVDAKSCFPLLSWFIFPTIGAALNELIKIKEDKQQIIMPTVIITSIVVFIICYFITSNYLHLDIKQFIPPFVKYQINIWGAIMSICISLALISINYYIYRLIKPVMNYILSFSSILMPFYMIQWILVSWFKVICEIIQPEKGDITIPIYLIITISITIISVILAQLFGEKLIRLIFKITYKVKY